MPRKARIKFAGILQHVIQCGSNRAACFFAEEDCRATSIASSKGTKGILLLCANTND